MRAPPVSEELDQELRSAFYDCLGEPLIEDFPSVLAKLETLVNQVGATDEEEESEEGAPPKKGLPDKKKKKLLDPKTWERDARLVDTATRLRAEIGGDLFQDHNLFRDRVREALTKLEITLSATDLKLILRAVSWRVETAPPVIAKIHKPGKAEADPFHGRYEISLSPSGGEGKGQGAKKTNSIVEYEPDTDLRDTEQVPLLEEGGIEAFIRREVLPYTPDAWVDETATKIGFEISFTRHFYKPVELRTLDQIRAGVLALEKETGGLLEEILKGGQ